MTPSSRFLRPPSRPALGLRTRLTLSYVLLFGVVMTSIGLTFHQALSVIFYQQAERLLDGEWHALKGFLRARDTELVWAYDPEHPEEAFTVDRLRRVFLLTDPQGEVVEMSNGYASIGRESPETVRRVLETGQQVTVKRTGAKGETYMVRMGPYGAGGRTYFVAIGLPVSETERVPSRMLAVYAIAAPVMLLAIAVLGWFAAGRALSPLMRVVEAARTVSGGNLSLRIEPLGTGDELDQLIETFNGMMERLEANFEQMKRFSVDASHELRTPLTAIRGQLEVAMLTARSMEDFRRAITTALEDVERLGRIVQSLLQLAQAETGQIRLNRQPEMLAEIAARQVAQFQPLAARKRIELRLLAPEPCLASVDRLQMERLVDNLLSNAIKYTQEGGRVEVRLREENGDAVLEVADNGPGIPEHHLPHIFEKFYRVREGERTAGRGVGLGLAFVRWIARAHGGTVQVRSRVGEGTTFEVRIPLGGEVARTETVGASR
ncbi:MAG: heavy metal sensor histidine kinase [Bryobacteraceae bacterium]|nr:heavy metal sensor histidine kinase [Bryobacteraceae bacterium]